MIPTNQIIVSVFFPTDKDLVGCLVDLFAAGTETTSTTLSWALLYLIHNPDIQERCRQEIITVGLLNCA